MIKYHWPIQFKTVTTAACGLDVIGERNYPEEDIEISWVMPTRLFEPQSDQTVIVWE